MRVFLMGFILSLQALWPSAPYAAVLPNVVVSTEVLKPLVDGVLKGVRESKALFDAGQSPHSAHLKPSQIALLEAADIVIVPDKDLTPALKPWFKKLQKRGAIIVELSALDEAQALPYRAENPFMKQVEEDHDDHEAHEEHHHEHHHDTKGMDPHFWLDPLRMANLLAPIAKAIGAYSPEIADDAAGNAQQLALHLRGTTMIELQKHLKKNARLTPKAGVIPFITAHDAYQYFTARFGLHEAGFMAQRPEAYQGARSTKELMEKARTSFITCVIAESETMGVKRLAQLGRAQVVLLNPERLYSSKEVPPLPWFENDYDRFMFAIVDGFAKCLR